MHEYDWDVGQKQEDGSSSMMIACARRCWPPVVGAARLKRIMQGRPHLTDLRRRRLGLRQPQGHVHGAIHLDGGGQRPYGQNNRTHSITAS